MFARFNMQLSPAIFRKVLPLLAFAFLLGIGGCDTPEKVLKSSNLEYKKAKATSWYYKKEYLKCIPVFEELMGLLKGRESIEEYYYMYCMANYKQGDYMISAYHFKNFYDQYTNGARAEECLFMYAKSYEQLSPKYELDQTYTYKALEAYSLFLSMYPDNKFLKEVNEAYEKLRRKLEKKALSNAELYYRTSNYKAAATTFENLLRDYPDIEESERIGFMVVKSNYRFAENSIPEKKADRFKHVIESYADFAYKFPGSKYIAEAKRFADVSHFQTVKGSFEWAETGPLTEREKLFRVAINEAKAQEPFLLNEKEKREATSLIEKSYFLMIKNNFLLAELTKDRQRMRALDQTVKTYYTFVDLFPKSRYIKEAERIFQNTQAQLTKQKTNGQEQKN